MSAPSINNISTMDEEVVDELAECGQVPPEAAITCELPGDQEPVPSDQQVGAAFCHSESANAETQMSEGAHISASPPTRSDSTGPPRPRVEGKRKAKGNTSTGAAPARKRGRTSPTTTTNSTIQATAGSPPILLSAGSALPTLLEADGMVPTVDDSGEEQSVKSTEKHSITEITFTRVSDRCFEVTTMCESCGSTVYRVEGVWSEVKAVCVKHISGRNQAEGEVKIPKDLAGRLTTKAFQELKGLLGGNIVRTQTTNMIGAKHPETLVAEFELMRKQAQNKGASDRKRASQKEAKERLERQLEESKQEIVRLQQQNQGLLDLFSPILQAFITYPDLFYDAMIACGVPIFHLNVFSANVNTLPINNISVQPDNKNSTLPPLPVVDEAGDVLTPVADAEVPAPASHPLADLADLGEDMDGNVEGKFEWSTELMVAACDLSSWSPPSSP